MAQPSQAARQVFKLLQEGYSPKEVADMLEYPLIDIQLIADGLVQARKAGLIPAPKETDTSASSPPTPAPHAEILESDSAEDIYKKAQKAVAARLTQIALNGTNEGVAAKALIYINEEATGRNEAKAKKKNGEILLNIGDALLQIANAKKAASIANDKIIDVIPVEATS